MAMGLGYNPALEAQHAEALAALPQLVCAPADPIPEEVDPRSVIKCNNQGPFNSCCGNARDKVVEFCHWIETGEAVNLSARFAYLTTKLVDGTLEGADNGASISGAALASTRHGECEEAFCPYWDWRNGERYSTDIPKAAWEQGSAHKLRSVAEVHSVDDIIRWIGAGQGGILFGIDWTQGLAGFRGSTLTRRDVGGRSIGGHALCLIGYLRDGRPILYNSHGEDWGDRGTAAVDPPVVEQWLRSSRFGFRGFSDLPSFRQRQFHGWKGVFA